MSSKSEVTAGVPATKAVQRYVDVDEAKRDDEIQYLRESIYLREVDLFTHK
jgi:hypothetical protein